MTQRDKPHYVRIAEALREEIEEGRLLPGQTLPKETDLAEFYGVSRMTLRQALDQLRSEGAIVTTQGRGSIVTPTHRRLDITMNRYRTSIRQALDGNPPDQPATPTPFGASIERETSTTEAGDAEAHLMGVAKGTPLLRVETLHSVAATPHTLTTSFYPLDLVAGTAIADPEAPHEDNIPALNRIGVRVTRVKEIKVARPPLMPEREALKIVGTASVMAITRQMYAGDRVVELARDIVYPGDRAQFVDEIDLTAEWG